MRPTMRFFMLAAAGVALLGCEQGSSEVPLALERNTADVATLSQSQGAVATPSQSHGAIIEFDETTVFFFNFDAERGLLSAHLPSDFCSGAPLNVGDRQIVTTPSEIRQRFVRIQDGESQVAIYRASSPNDLFSDFCGFLQGPNKVAEGTVRHSQTLSNASFAAHWGGTVESIGGATLHLSEVFQLTADAHDPNNAAEWSFNVEKILLSSR